MRKIIRLAGIKHSSYYIGLSVKKQTSRSFDISGGTLRQTSQPIDISKLLYNSYMVQIPHSVQHSTWRCTGFVFWQTLGKLAINFVKTHTTVLHFSTLCIGYQHTLVFPLSGKSPETMFKLFKLS